MSLILATDICIIGRGDWEAPICAANSVGGWPRQRRWPSTLPIPPAAIGHPRPRSPTANAVGRPGRRRELVLHQPQVYPSVAAAVSGIIPSRALIVSIMAGISIDRMRSDLGHEAVVRVMPNAAARVLESASVWMAAPGVTEAQHAQAEQLLSALGVAVEVAEERFLDLATGLSGPGPAYLCLVAEALIEGGVAAGFSRALAHRLVQQTFVGTAALLSEPGAHPAFIRESVTSPGGTTAAGLQALERSAVRAAFVDAVDAARRRCQELGGSR